MKLFIIGGLLLGASACGSAPSMNIPEIPVIHIGTGGVHTSAMQGTPEGLYRDLYSAMPKAHIVVRKNLGENSLAVSQSMEDIVHNLERMRTLVADPIRPRISEMIERYKGFALEFKSRRYSNATMAQFDQSEIEIRTALEPDNMQYVAEIPASPAKEIKKETVQSPVQGDTLIRRSDPPPQVSEGELPTWMVYKAWEQADQDLQDAYRKNQGGYEKYVQRVRESMALIKARLPEGDRPKFQYYLNEYERIISTTQGFASLPEGATREDVMADLKNVSRVVSETYSPDRK